MNSEQIKLQTPKGVHDILPEYHQFFTYVKKVMRHRCRQAGFKRISTPIFEYTEVFTRSIGDTTDVVAKEMYTFEDKGGNSLSLRPELTAGVVRAYLQHGMKNLPQPVELYSIEPVFRHDRPQKGRFRQFHQLNCEVLGEKDAAIDAQMIQLGWRIMEDLKIADILEVHINSIGCNKSDCRPRFLTDLKDYYLGKERSLCDHCKSRIEKSPLRLLDCKEEDCRILASMGPKLKNYLCAECVEFHSDLKEYLTEMEIPFVENDIIVRGLDYYTNTVFEFWDKTRGAQNAVLGGGRYDDLISTMGGEPTPAVGWAAGVERLISNMKEKNIKAPHKDYIHVFVAQLGKEAKKKCLGIIKNLRDAGVKTVGALGKGSIKAQMRLADKFEARYALILGLTEVREGVIILRDMKRGSQKNIPLSRVVEDVVAVIGTENLDIYSPGDLSLE